jgi:tetratricopeptide (TPR) repeat protein
MSHLAKISTFSLLLYVLLNPLSIKAQNLEIDSLISKFNIETDLNTKIDLCSSIGFKSMIFSKDIASSYQSKLDSIWKIDKSEKARLSSLLLKAKINRWNDCPNEAVHSFMKVLDLKPDSLIVADVYFNLGVVYSSLHFNAKAISSLKKSLRVYKMLNKLGQIHNIYNCIADVYNYNIGNYSLAEKYYLQALSAFAFLPESDKMNTLGLQSLSAIHNNIGVLYSSMKKYKQAEEHLTNSLSIAKKMNDSIGVFHSSISLSQMFNRRSLFSSAMKILIPLRKKYNNKPPYLKVEYLRELIKASAGVKKYKEAYLLTDEYALLRDSIYSIDVVKQVNRAEQKYLCKVKIEKANLDAEKEEKRYLMFFLFSGFLLIIMMVLAIVYLYYRFKLKKSEVNTLQKNNKEVLTKAIKSSCVDNVLNDLLGDLKKFASEEKLQKVGLEHLNDIIKRLSHSSNSLAKWEDFEMLFTSVYSNFYRNLDKKHTNLSLSERKLCTLIRLDFSNLDIANFLSIDQISVFVAKSRLKKKMDLESGVDLYYYLSTF